MRTLLALTCLALTACPDVTKDKPKATVAPSVPTTDLAPLQGAVPFTFSGSGSTVAFLGAKVTGKHEGGFRTFTGTLEVVAGDVTKSRVIAQIDMSSAFTDSERLTGHLTGPDFFDVQKFPTARFVSSSITADGTHATVTGDLTLHGVTKRITFPAEIALAADAATVSAQFAINRKDFEIVYAGKADDLISDDVLLTLKIAARK